MEVERSGMREEGFIVLVGGVAAVF